MARFSQDNSQAFPNISSPFVALTNGNITQAWLQFLITLWNRTGGGTGNAATPSGTIAAFGGGTAPGGWFPCDGSAQSRSVYANLFAAIGTNWGNGDGTGTFNLPDLRNRFIVGAGLIYNLAQLGGAANQSLSVSNLPSHNHGIIDPGHVHMITDPEHHHTSATPASNGTAGAGAVGATAGNTGDSPTGITINRAETGIMTQDTGNGDSFPILPPYGAVFYMIKY